MNYERILSRALRISWRHKYLWLLALLAGEGTAFGWSMSGPSGFNGNNQAHHHYGPAAPTSTQVGTWITAHAGLLWAAGITVVLVAVALVLISAIANGAVIKGAAEHDLERPFGLGAAWRSGVTTFWPVLGVKLLSGLIGLVTVAVIGSFVLVAVGSAYAHMVGLAVPAGIVAGLLALVAIPFWVVFAVAVLLAQRAIVLDGQRPVAALGTGFALIRRRFGRVALLWLVVGVIGILLSLAVRIVVVIVALPLIGIVAAAYFTGGLPVAIGFGSVLGVVWLALVLALVAAVDAYTSTAWTLAYRRFDEESLPTAAAGPMPA